jgi:DNA polymerase-3 subunit gamma/tau
MTLALYRKYRPKTFADLVGQNHIKITLQSELEGDNIAHAYLFSGPRGLGKTTTARLLAKSLNCQKRAKGASEPCNECDSCSEFNNSKGSVDVVEIDAASHTGVDNVRENIIQNARFAPVARAYKIFIIDEVHMLSTPAFNALLKTLEEPPARVLFILATTELHKVPQTIISRCQHFEFRKVSQQDMVNRLMWIAQQESKSISEAVLKNIASSAEGSLRDAESLLGQILSLDEKNITDEQAELVLSRPRHDSALELIDLTYKQNASSAILLLNELLDDGVQMNQFAGEIIETLRLLMLGHVGANIKLGIVFSEEYEDKAKLLIKNCSLNFLTTSLEVFMTKKQELKFSDMPQLPLELAILEIIESLNNKNDDFNNDNEEIKTIHQTKEEKPKLEVKAEAKEVKTDSDAWQPAKKELISNNKEIQVEAVIKKAKNQIDIKEIKKNWAKVLTSLEKHHHPLAVTLKMSEPVSIDEYNVLRLNCHHRFHQQRIMEHKNRVVIEQVFDEIFGDKVIISVDVVEGKIEPVKVESKKTESFNEDIPSQDQSDGSLDGLDGILEAFDGEVV